MPSPRAPGATMNAAFATCEPSPGWLASEDVGPQEFAVGLRDIASVRGVQPVGESVIREMSGSNEYVSPDATTTRKMSQIASRSASIAGAASAEMRQASKVLRHAGGRSANGWRRSIPKSYPARRCRYFSAHLMICSLLGNSRHSRASAETGASRGARAGGFCRGLGGLAAGAGAVPAAARQGPAPLGRAPGPRQR